MKYINPSKLLAGDVLLITDASIPSLIIRRRTWPKRGWFDMSAATHCAVVCDRGGGLYYASEMLPQGLAMSELQRYDNKPLSWLNHIIAVRRHPAFSGPGDDAFSLREKANRFIIDTHSFGVKYGYDKLWEMIFPKSNDDPYSMICSQWTARVFANAKIEMPFKDLCTPADWQNWSALMDIQFS